SGSHDFTGTTPFSGAGTVVQLSGTMIFDTAATINSLIQNAPGTIQITPGSGALTSPNLIQLNGTLTGAGTITGNVSNAGAVNPGLGAATGIFNIAGSYSQTSA